MIGQPDVDGTMAIQWVEGTEPRVFYRIKVEVP